MKKLFLITSLTLLFGFALTAAQTPDAVYLLGLGTNGAPPFVGTTDLDNDGDGDLVMVSWLKDSVITMLGNGLGQFGTRRAFGVGPTPGNVQLVGADFADFNNDGNMDVVVASQGTNFALIYWGDGTGALSAPLVGGGTSCFAVATGYFDSDFNPDFALLLSYPGIDSVQYWFGNGLNPGAGANFFGGVEVSTGGDQPYFLAKWSDSNFLPARTHVATANYGSGNFSVIVSNGNGTFQAPATFATRPNPIGVVWDYLDNDNVLDIAVADFLRDSVFVHKGINLTAYGAAVGYQVGINPVGLAGADFTGDGRVDLATANQGSPDASILVNNGSGGFRSAINAPARFGSYTASAGDINRNGVPDLLLGTYNADSAIIFNLQSPSVSPVSIPGNPASGAPLSLPTITARDSTNIASVELMYRQVGQTAYTSFPLTAGAGTATQRDYTGTLPVGTMTNRGLEYFFRTSDGFVTASVEPSTSIFPFRRLRTSIAENAPPTLNRSYQLVSFPFGFTSGANGSASIQIADDFSLTDSNVARLFWWDPVKADTITTDTSRLNGYREFGSSGFPNFQPGLSMFLATVGQKTYDASLGLSTLINGLNFSLLPSGDSVLLEYYVPPAIDSGWNMIATPFAFTIHMDSVDIFVPALGGDIHEGTDTVRTNRIGLGGANLRERTASGYIVPNPPLLKPWRGYFLKNSIKQQVQLFFPKKDDNFPLTAPPAPKAIAAGLDWKIDIAARSGELEIPPTTLGTSKAALPGYDQLDWELPPALPGDLRVVFQRGKDFGAKGDYLTDIRPTLTESEVWSFTVQPGGTRAIELNFGGLADIPEDYDVILADKEGRAKQNLRLEPVYHLIASGDRHFELTVAPKTTGQTVLMPTKYDLHQNFPNPFNPQTLIKYDLPEAATVQLDVFNILGQKVTTLVNRFEAAGPKSVVWNGTDELGAKVSSGIYFYKISTDDFSATKKMMLVK